jgi:hypothetical protein
LTVLRPFHYVNWNRQDNTWPTSKWFVDQQLVNWSSTRHYDYIHSLWSSLSPEEKKKKRKRERGREKSSFFLILPLNEESSYVLFAVVPHRAFFPPLLLIERVFIWQRSVKYEMDQSTLDFVSEQTMHAFNEKISNPSHRLHLL